MLKIASPQIIPKSNEKGNALSVPEKTKYIAYPPESEANSAVKKIVAPMPKYLLCSVGYFKRVSLCAPEQNQKKSVNFFIHKPDARNSKLLQN
jgi:hypothetical protein